MSPLKDIGARPRLLLAGLVGLLALALGFFSLSDEQALSFVTHAGYWFIFATVILFGRALYLIVRADWAGWRWNQAMCGSLALIVACGVLLQVHEPRGFKILMDEILLLGSSMSLHLDKTPLVPLRGNDLQGAFQLLSGILDKRPLFFPVALSMVHDLAGYRPENAFWLNSGLTFVLLGLVFLVGRRLAGIRGGVLAVLLLTSLPLVSQNATGGGFELLNLVMQVAVALLGARYVEKRDSVSLSAFCLAGVLLAQTRYESVLFVPLIAALVVWVWWQQRAVILPWPVIVSPLLLLVYPLQNRVFDVRAQSWELSSQPGYEKVFSPSYLYDNIGHAAAFFFDLSGNAPNSPLLAGLGLIAIPFLLLQLGKQVRTLRTASPLSVSLAFFTVGYLALTGLLLCYFWGRFDDPVIRRLSLPLHVFMIIAIVAVLGTTSLRARGWNVLIGIVAVFLFAWSIPVMARHAYTLQYAHAGEVAWRRELISRHPAKDFLVIDNSSIIWITHEVSSTAVGQARARKDAIAFLLKNRSFSAVYAWQHFDVDPNTHALRVDKDDDLSADFELETVEERRFKALAVTRLSRVVGVKPGAPSPEVLRAAEDFAKLTPAEREKIRRQYFENWLRQLP
jgi:hypothetical protein